MKKITLFFSLLGMISFGQTTVDFESGGTGASWTWTVDDNSTNPALEIVANPNASGINTSATVAKFTALAAGQDWALSYTDNIGIFMEIFQIL